MQKKYFPGAKHYFLLEGEYRNEAELLKDIDSLVNERIRFKEEWLNPIVFRMGDAHCKIKLGLSVLAEFDEKKKELAVVTLEAQLVEDVIENNLLKMAEVLKELYIGLNKDIRSDFGFLLRRIGKVKLKNVVNNEQDYNVMRLFLFPDEKKDQINVSNEAMMSLSKRIEALAEKVVAFRDKVIAHKNDAQRFETYLTYEEYLVMFDSVVKYLDAISIVVTLRENDWAFLGRFDQKSITKRWLNDGLTASLFDVANKDYF